MDQSIHQPKRGFLSGGYTILIFLWMCLFQACTEPEKEVRIIFTGDILLSRNVRAEYNNTGTNPWIHLQPIFRNADLVVGNLEGTVGQPPDSMSMDPQVPVFGIEESDIPLLHEAGFTAITVENNHSYDLGDQGKQATINALANTHIKPVSLENAPRFFTIRNHTIALLAINLVKDRDGREVTLPSIEVAQKLRMARRLADYVIVCVHWGSELLGWPNNKQREDAKWLTEHGVDVIIGSHPHVIQPVEQVGEAVVFYSLGNHLFDQKYAATKTGLMVECIISNGVMSFKGMITHVKDRSFVPEVQKEESYPYRVSHDHEPYTVNGVSLHPISLSGNRTVLEGYVNNKKVWRSHPIRMISIDAGKLDGQEELLLLLEKHRSRMDRMVSIRPYVYHVGPSGFTARWRGSALAWPMLDAVINPEDNRILCALHRGDSFINLDTTNTQRRIMAYQWNGFGFSGMRDTSLCARCEMVEE